MKLIRADQIFRFMENLAFLRRQQLGAYRRIANIFQHLAELFVFRGLRFVLHQIPHQRFRDGYIHPILFGKSLPLRDPSVALNPGLMPA